MFFERSRYTTNLLCDDEIVQIYNAAVSYRLWCKILYVCKLPKRNIKKFPRGIRYLKIRLFTIKKHNQLHLCQIGFVYKTYSKKVTSIYLFSKPGNIAWLYLANDREVACNPDARQFFISLFKSK